MYSHICIHTFIHTHTNTCTHTTTHAHTYACKITAGPFSDADVYALEKLSAVFNRALAHAFKADALLHANDADLTLLAS